LISVNPITGLRKLVSDFGDETQGPSGVDPARLAIDASGSVFVIDPSAGTSLESCEISFFKPGCGALFKVDPLTGNRILVSDFGVAAKGTIGVFPFALAIDASGDVFVLDLSAGTPRPPCEAGCGALFRVNPVTGVRTLLSNFGVQAQGPLGSRVSGVAAVRSVTPPPPPAADTCNGQSATAGCNVNGVAEQPCLGTSGDDLIEGTSGSDVIIGLDGNDNIIGAAGADTICGGDGNDTLAGGKGKDQLFGEDGDDTLKGGRGADLLDGDIGNDACLGGLGSDSAANCEDISNVP
jgi:hypothetical protein